MLWLVVVLGYVVILVMAFHVERALTHRWDADRAARERRDTAGDALHGREIAVDERTVALEEAKFERQNAVAQSKEMPEELLRRIDAWEDDWAKENERAGIMALYAEFGDWQKVMQKLPPLVSQ